MGGGGGAAGAYSNQSGPATVYNPTGQGAADTLNQQIMQSIAAQFGGPASANIAANAPSTGLFDFSQTPGGQAYRTAQEWTGNIPGLGSVFDPTQPLFQTLYQGGVLPAAGYLNADLGPSLERASSGVLGATGMALGQAAPQALQAGGALNQYGNQILQTAFDPQKELYNQLSNQVGQQQNAINAMSGVGNTPYGAGLTGNQLQDFNLKWQNQQLARQAAGLGAAEPAFAQGAALPFAPAQAAAGTYGAGGNLGRTAASDIVQGAGLPYQTVLQGATGTAGALTPIAALGNQQYALPQQLIGDTNQYLQTGQNASQISGYLGNLGAQQQAQAFGGIGQALGGIGGLATGLGGLSS